MASPAQLQANRLNALKSTGPSSVEGKAVTRFNSLKTGVDSKTILLPGEDPEALAALSEHYYKQFAPEGPEQTALCDTVIRADWDMRRFERIEEQILATIVAAVLADDPENPYPLGAAYLADCKNGNALQKAFRRRQAAKREWDKARTELRRIKAECPSPQQAQPVKPAAPSAQLPRTEQETKNWVRSESPEQRR
jgi:hypothetical protein